jgi:hypothetical protein
MVFCARVFGEEGFSLLSTVGNKINTYNFVPNTALLKPPPF